MDAYHEALAATDSSQVLQRLNEQAKECLRRLRELIERAEKAHHTHRTASTTSLLANVERNAGNSLRLLEIWRNDFGNGKLTGDKHLLDTTSGLFQNLLVWIDKAYDALDSRLLFRRLILISFFLSSKRKDYEKRLIKALKDIEDTIGKLIAHSKILSIEGTRELADRRNKVQSVRLDTNQPYLNFCQFFNKLRLEEKGNIRYLALEVLWEQFHEMHDQMPDLDGKVGNAEDPGDGLLYDSEHVSRANALLKDLHQAWTNIEDHSSFPAPGKLPKMGMICLVLMGMRQQQLLGDFLDGGICDENLPLERAQLQKVLRDQHLDYMGTFLSEQYRVKPRDWDEGHHAKMEDEEPLPLVTDKWYRKGSYGNVKKVREPVSGTPYALKEQIICSVASRNFEARKHLEDEMNRLKRLQHKHVVRLVKSYERAGSFGLLLAPAATSDLEGLLLRFHKNKFSAPEGCLDQKWLRPILLTAFGCLSQGLAYIHGQDIRHKDIKPENILYEKAVGENGGPRFLWADFGLAYDFSDTGNSKTDSTKIYSKRYAAPEILMSSINYARIERPASVMSLDRILESREASRNVEASEQEDKILSAFKEDEETDHGRKTDIFSLGCVFFEVLAALVHEELPMDSGRRSSIYRPGAYTQRLPDGRRIAAAPIASDDDMFCKHTNNLKVWAQSHSAPSNTQNQDPTKAALAPLFTLATTMISLKAKDRPSIDDVVRKIAAVGKQYFCQACWIELLSERKSAKSIECPSPVKEKGTKRDRQQSPKPESSESGSGSAMSLLRRSTAMLHADSRGPATQIRNFSSR